MVVTTFGACEKNDAENTLKAAAMPVHLEQVDMCGPQKNTEALFKEAYDKGGTDALLHWFDEKISKATVELLVCSDGEHKLRTTYIYLQTLDSSGKPVVVLRQWGSKKDSRGTKTWNLNIYPDTRSKQPFGFGAIYVP